MCDARWVPLEEQVMLTTQTYTRRHLLASAAAFLIVPLLASAASTRSAPRVRLRTIPVEESAQLANSGGSNRAAE